VVVWLGIGHLSEAQRPRFRGVRVALGTGYNCVRGPSVRATIVLEGTCIPRYGQQSNRVRGVGRAWRNGGAELRRHPNRYSSIRIERITTYSAPRSAALDSSDPVPLWHQTEHELQHPHSHPNLNPPPWC
jgi:hypothetical protein